MAHIKTEKQEKGSYGSAENDQGSMMKDGDDKKKGGGGGFHRKKVCRFCSDNEFVMDYKDISMMQSFVSEHGRLVPRRISGTCALHQRKLTSAIKRARNLALVGYVSMGA